MCFLYHAGYESLNVGWTEWRRPCLRWRKRLRRHKSINRHSLNSRYIQVLFWHNKCYQEKHLWGWGMVDLWSVTFRHSRNVWQAASYQSWGINWLRPRQNGCCYAGNIFISIFFMKKFVFRFKCDWNLFLSIQLAISQHLCREWLGTEQATSH